MQGIPVCVTIIPAALKELFTHCIKTEIYSSEGRNSGRAGEEVTQDNGIDNDIVTR